MIFYGSWFSDKLSISLGIVFVYQLTF